MDHLVMQLVPICHQGGSTKMTGGPLKTNQWSLSNQTVVQHKRLSELCYLVYIVIFLGTWWENVSVQGNGVARLHLWQPQGHQICQQEGETRKLLIWMSLFSFQKSPVKSFCCSLCGVGDVQNIQTFYISCV